jgi:hypothetical protein
MEHTFESLSKLNVTQLREIADGVDHDAVQGHMTMHKDHLIHALCTALGIDAHVHHEVKGLNKAKVKAQIKALKGKRDAAIEARDHAQVKFARRRIHALKRKIHRATI